MKKIFKTIGLAVVGFAFSPMLAFAASTHHYVCADLTLTAGSGSTCSANVWTFPTANQLNYWDDTTTAYHMTSGTTYYINYVATPISPGGFLRLGVGDGAGTVLQQVESVNITTTRTDTDVSFTATSDGYFYMRENAAGGSFRGTVETLCISDTAGDCASGGGGGGGGGGGAVAGGIYPIASSTAAVSGALISVGGFIALVVAAIFGGIVALMGVGYARRKLGKLFGGDSFADGDREAWLNSNDR